MKSNLSRSLQQDSGRQLSVGDRVPTGIDEFDGLIEGGFPKGSLILVAGNAGSGKTIFSAEYLYNGASKFREPGLYVSFGESREVFLRDMKRVGMDFEKCEKAGLVKFMDLASAEEQGMQGFLQGILSGIKAGNVKRLVIDSFSALASAFSERYDSTRALHTILGKVARASGVTTILTCERPSGPERGGLEEFLADGVVALNSYPEGGRLKRRLQVIKMRGTKIKITEHSYYIDEHGIRVHPLPEIKPNEEVSSEKVSTGIKGMDEMFNGGFLKGSVTLVAGPSGTGKTTAALHFINEGAKHNERGLYVSFDEPVPELMQQGEGFGCEMKELVNSGVIRLAFLYPTSTDVEPQFERITDLLLEHRPARFAIDSLTPLMRAIPESAHTPYLKGLISCLKADGVTSLFTIVEDAMKSTTSTGISTLVDNIIALRHVELESTLKRSLVIFKARGSSNDSDIREFEITPRGMAVKGKFIGVERILAGSARRSLSEEAARNWAKAFGGKK